MGPEKRRCYTVKTYDNNLYTWCPDNSGNKIVGNSSKGGRKTFCNATALSQGEDWVCRYVYDTALVSNEQKRLAYVACDYVK